jgi:hypothetical protein
VTTELISHDRENNLSAKSACQRKGIAMRSLASVWVPRYDILPFFLRVAAGITGTDLAARMTGETDMLKRQIKGDTVPNTNRVVFVDDEVVIAKTIQRS